jgi:hypothetical protein
MHFPALLLPLVLGLAGLGARAEGPRPGETVALVGGAAMVAAAEAGAVETVLVLARPERPPRVRSFAWEGDTVFARPRDLNFPPLARQLADAGVTLAGLAFGAAEALDDAVEPAAFRAAYAALLDGLAAPGRRFVLVTPAPFEARPAPLPSLAPRNGRLARLAAETRALAAERGLPVVDVFAAFTARPPAQPWTTDGREASAAGHEAAAAVWAEALRLPAPAARAADPEFWRAPAVAAVRDAVRARHRLWFDCSRPTNWAFLHGDRADQPSSRDHRDRRVRWFPAELERFVPLIAAADERVASLAAEVQ